MIFFFFLNNRLGHFLTSKALDCFYPNLCASSMPVPLTIKRDSVGRSEGSGPFSPLFIPNVGGS